jgi:hypothetical protein
MAKKPRPTKGVPEPVFQRELFNYLKRKEANPGKNVDASFVYNGIKYTFERGNGPYHSGFQIKKSSDQAAKQSAKSNKDRKIKLSEGEKMFRQTYYDVAAERNAAEGRTGQNKLEVDHKISRADKGLDHPYNLGLMERKENGRKGADSNYGKYKYEPLVPPPALQNVLNDTFRPKFRRPVRTTTNELGGQNLPDSDAQTEVYINDPYEYTPKGAQGLPHPATSTYLPLKGV